MPASHLLGRGNHSRIGGEAYGKIFSQNGNSNYLHHRRSRIRFVTSSDEAIEVLCKAYNAMELHLHRVKELKPVKKPKLDNWLEPKVYTGTVGEETEQESD